MGELRYDQSNFTNGELDPKLYGRNDYEGYIKGCKKLRNCIVLPQGAAQRRWGHKYVDRITQLEGDGQTNYIEVSTFNLDTGEEYLLVWTDRNLDIYLENNKVNNLAHGYTREDIQNLRFSQVDNAVLIANENFPPAILNRVPSANNGITGSNPVLNILGITNALPINFIYPAKFNTTGALPTTTPQIKAGRVYFIRVVGNFQIKIYSNIEDAVNNVNFYITDAVAGNNSNLQLLNTWTIGNIVFKNKPTYDFSDNYANIDFTSNLVTGNVTIVLSIAIPNLDNTFIGGIFSSSTGGIVRITGADPAHIFGYTIQDFPNLTPIRGVFVKLEEPLWSATRGWPRTVAFHQQRLIFAGTALVPNAQNLSAINDYYDFDDSQTLDDDAISYYPQSGRGFPIRSLTSTKSLITHAATGNYSTPLTLDLPLTPKTFSASPQNRDSVSYVQPIDIDNQVLYTDRSGNNVSNMVWDIGQSSYITNKISVPSSQVLNSVIDAAGFTDPSETNGSFALFLNADGTLAVFQTLVQQGIAAWTLSDTSGVLYGNSPLPGYFRRIASSDNRCWFVIERSVPVANAPVNIAGFSAIDNTLTAVAHGMIVGAPNLVTIAGAPLPLSVPQLVNTKNYWAVPVDLNTFKIYVHLEDASNGQNEIQIQSAGTNARVTYWPIKQRYFIEEVDFTAYTDSSLRKQTGGNLVVNGLDHLNGETVQIVADGYVVLGKTVVNGSITLDTEADEVIVGRKYVSLLTPMPINNILADGNTVYKPKHIRDFYVRFYKSFGFKIQGNDQYFQKIRDIHLDDPPPILSGVIDYTLMIGWQGADPGEDIEITQELPLPMTILGISYILEV